MPNNCDTLIVGGGHHGGHLVGGHGGRTGLTKQTTYLVDHHPQLFEHPPSLTNYATMPRYHQDIT